MCPPQAEGASHAIRDNVPAGAPCWVDLMSSDVEQSRAFYGELFGWTADEPNEEFGGYINFPKDGEQVAGADGRRQEAGVPDVWSVYLAVDDAEKTVEAATANGGQVFVEPMAVGDLGTMARPRRRRRRRHRHVAARRAQGFGVVGEPAARRAGSSSSPATTTTTVRVLPGRVRLGHPDPAATRPSSATPPRRRRRRDGRDHGRLRLPARGRARPLVGVLRASTTPTRPWPRSSSSAARRSSPAEDTPYGVLATAADATGAMFKLRAAP